MSDDPTETKGASPAERMLSRAEVFTEAVKSLILVNGGGAVALLAFLQAVWDRNVALARLSLIGICFMLAGVTFALVIPFFRVPHSHRAEQTEDLKTWMWYAYYACAYLSVGSFFVGWGYLVVGALRLLR